MASSDRRVLEIPHPDTSNHNGGQLQFGPDGYLYIATGDGGKNPDAAANRNVLLGKLLRIDPRKRRGRAYTVPSRNPYVGRSGRNEIYSYGLRNPWRFSFDSANGRLTIGDVGAGSREEVNYVTRATAKRGNFGWPRWEGDQPHPETPVTTHPYSRSSPIPTPTAARSSADTWSATRMPGLAGRYLYTDLCNGDIRSFVPSLGGASDDRSTGLSVNSPTSFGEGCKGRIYVASFEGGVYRLRASP